MSKKYKLKKFLVRRYQILATILLVLSAGLVLLPKYKKNEGINPEVFVKNAINTERYISTDILVDRMIKQDPSILLIDTRSEKEYEEFTLPGAINVPLKNLLDDDFNYYINQSAYDVILFSNDNLYADQAWMLGNRLGYKNLYVLEGGLNQWFKTIVNPVEPEETMPKEAFDLYAFRKAAGMYFGIGIVENELADNKIENAKPAPVKKVVPVQKKKKRAPEGGC
jgi:rhodanese-related sulfurtransferase